MLPTNEDTQRRDSNDEDRCRWEEKKVLVVHRNQPWLWFVLWNAAAAGQQQQNLQEQEQQQEKRGEGGSSTTRTTLSSSSCSMMMQAMTTGAARETTTRDRRRAVSCCFDGEKPCRNTTHSFLLRRRRMMSSSSFSSIWMHFFSRFFLGRTPLMPLLFFLLFTTSSLVNRVEGAIYFGNSTYASVPGNFGRFMMENERYVARLQYLHENAFLCQAHDPNQTSFVVPESLVVDDSTNLTVQYQKVALVAARGECPFYEKAKIAESIHPSIEFLLVYNYHMTDTDGKDDDNDEEKLVPMSSEYGTTNLVLLSVTHAAGTAMKQYIHNQTQAVLDAGGPQITMDATLPPGFLTVDDLYEMLLSALGLFFMLLSLSGCMIILVGTYGQLHDAGQLLVWNNSDHGGTADPLGENGGGGGGRRLPVILGRSVLTETQVRQLSEWSQSNHKEAAATAGEGGIEMQELRHAEDGAASSDTVDPTSTTNTATTTGGNNDNNNTATGSSPAAENNNNDSNCCAVCIDEIDESDGTTIVLPCRHRFHADCIIPWLTERQAKCPLCKYDVLEHVRKMEHEQQQQHHAGGTVGGTLLGRSRGAAAAVWNRIVRYRWTRVGTQDDPDDDQAYLQRRRDGGGGGSVVIGGVVIGADEMQMEEHHHLEDDDDDVTSNQQFAMEMTARHID